MVDFYFYHTYASVLTYIPCTAVGYQASAADGKSEQPNAVLEALIAVVRPTGGLGIPGLYVPSDPGAPDSASAKSVFSFRSLEYR
jgi:hypothetical protein